MNIVITHPELNLEKTLLSADVAAAATSSTVENTKGFSTNYYTVFGKPGEELTEIVLLSSVTAPTTLGHTTAPLFAHSARTQISHIKYNQARIYTATTETGTYTLLTTVDLTMDQNETVYNDTTGASSTWYKIKYYNETTAALSSFSSAVQGTGYTEDSLFSMTETVLEEFGDTESKELSRDEVRVKLRAGVRKIIAEVFKTYPDYFKTYTTITPNGTGLDPLPDRFLGLLRADISPSTTSSTNASKTKYFDESKELPNTTYNSAEPKITIRGSNLVTKPTLSASGMIFIWYWAYPEVMTDDSDEHGLAYGARDILTDFALYKIWTSVDKDTGVGTRAYSYRQLYEVGLENFVEFVSQSRQQINSKTMDVAFGSDLYTF